MEKEYIEDEEIEQEPIKKSNKKFLLILVGIIAVIIIIGIVIVTNNNPNNVNPSINILPGNRPNPQNCREVQVPYTVTEEIEQIEYYNETVPYEDEKCETEDLPYKIDNFVKDSITCNEEKKECDSCWYGACRCITYCVDKSISSSLELFNLDSEESGVWNIKMKFYESGTNNMIASDEESIFLYPQDSANIQFTAQIKGDGIDGNANIDLFPNYFVTKKATKTTCGIVTKYEEIQRKKIIVVPIDKTKYRKETVCN